jgi:hypothetical protein
MYPAAFACSAHELRNIAIDAIDEKVPEGATEER